MYSNLLITVHYFILSDQWNVCIYGYMCKVEDDGELFYSLDDGNTRFSDLLQLVEFYQLNRGVLPCKLKHHCARTTLWTHPKTPVQSPFDLSVCFMDFLKTFYSKPKITLLQTQTHKTCPLSLYQPWCSPLTSLRSITRPHTFTGWLWTNRQRSSCLGRETQMDSSCLVSMFTPYVKLWS